MDIRNHHQRPTQLRSPRMEAIVLPNAQEGVGNALRTAFSTTPWTIPEDMQQLLERIDR